MPNGKNCKVSYCSQYDTKSPLFCKLYTKLSECTMHRNGHNSIDDEVGGSNSSDYYEALSTKVGKLVDEKQAAYGNSFGKAGEFLKLLYPDGIKPDQYGDALTLVRIFDKQMRIATDKDAFGESPYQDIAGYGLLGMGKDNANTKKSED